MPDISFLNEEDNQNFVDTYLAQAIEDQNPEYFGVEICWLTQYSDGLIRIYISYETDDGDARNDNIYCKFVITKQGFIEDFREYKGYHNAD